MKKLSLILLTLTICGLQGCRQMSASESNTTGPVVDAKADVIRASKKLTGLKSLSAIVVGTGGATDIKKDVQFVAPDKYHIKFDDETGAHVEMINIGDESYLRSGDSWTKLPGNSAASSTFRNSFTDDVLETISDVKFEGEDTLNGKPMLVYTYKLTTKAVNNSVNQKIWIDKSTGIPIKSVGEYSDSQVRTLTTTFDPETPVSIEAPATSK